MRRLGVTLLTILLGPIVSFPGFSQTSEPRENIPPGVPADVRSEIERLYTKDAADAALNLGEMGENAAPAIPFLIGLLHRNNGLMGVERGKVKLFLRDDFTFMMTRDKAYVWGAQAFAAADALVKIGPSSIESLGKALRHEKPAVVSMAAYALAMMKGPAALELLLGVLEDENFSARAEVAEYAGYSRDPRVVSILIGFSESEDPKMRSASAKALGTTKDARAVDSLLAALLDDHHEVRKAAVLSLKRMKNPRSVEPLIRALKDEDKSVRNYSCQALGAIKDSRAIEPLIDVLSNDANSLVKSQASRALKNITGKKLGKNAKRWQDWWEKNKATFAEN